MGAEPDFIPGIYNYCDRWCERCAYTSRCLQFQIESEETQSSDALRDFDALNARFWQDMGEALVQAMRLLREMAVQQGIDPEDLHKETVLYSETLDTLQRTAREHPCATAALVYSGMVNEWFAAVDELSEAEVSLLTDHPFFLMSISRLSGIISILSIQKLSVPSKAEWTLLQNNLNFKVMLTVRLKSP